LYEPGSKHAYQKGSRAWPSGLQMGKGMGSLFFLQKGKENLGRKCHPWVILSISLLQSLSNSHSPLPFINRSILKCIQLVFKVTHSKQKPPSPLPSSFISLLWLL
jgi:hypothetical protein